MQNRKLSNFRYKNEKSANEVVPGFGKDRREIIVLFFIETWENNSNFIFSQHCKSISDAGNSYNKLKPWLWHYRNKTLRHKVIYGINWLSVLGHSGTLLSKLATTCTPAFLKRILASKPPIWRVRLESLDSENKQIYFKSLNQNPFVVFDIKSAKTHDNVYYSFYAMY